MPRRTPTLTSAAREVFEAEFRLNGFLPGVTIPKVAEATGLTEAQARDAIMAPSADQWRAALAAQLLNEGYAVG
jgi:hypothetical protein